MELRVPSFFLLVPGPWREQREVLRALKERGIEAKADEESPIQDGEIRVRLVEAEGLAQAFSWGREGALDADLVARIGMCQHAALVETGRRLNESAPQAAQLGRALRDAGGLAVRMEASGGASPWETWLEHLESGTPGGVYASAVVVVQGGDGALFTCGMHHFDMPDAEIALNDAREAIAWLDTLCVYQLGEDPELASGHTFQPNPEAARRVLERWPDHRHDPSDGRYNPFGLWRLQEPGAARVEAMTLIPTIVPTLVSQLSAAERSKGRALTRPEVERLVSESPAITLKPRTAQAMERSRGYADIEPQLAWDQWQIARRTVL